MIGNLWSAIAVLSISASVHAQIVVSANESKYELLGGEQRVIPDAQPDSLTVLDFSEFPPRVRHAIDVPNTVIGPPSNVAISPDRAWALVASSIELDAMHEIGFRADTRVQLVDLTATPIKVVDVVHVDKQPSGLSVTADGRLALVACRESNTVSVIHVDGQTLKHLGDVVVCEAGEAPTDVDILPDGRSALVTISKGQYLRLLEIDGQNVRSTDRKISTFGTAYDCDISEDGRVAAVTGFGRGNHLDANAVTIVDLTGDQPRAVQYVDIGVGPESCAVSPDGNLIAVALINGSNRAEGAEQFNERGRVTLLARNEHERFEVVQHVEAGRIPEGLTFVGGGQHLVVQCHPDQELWLFEVDGKSLVDTGHRIGTPGFPSGIDAR